MQAKKTQNILIIWYEHNLYLSSDLNPNPIHRRDDVEYIYEKFKDFWGLPFFETTMLDALDHDQDYFLFPVLGTPTFASYYYLMEIALLLAFAGQHHLKLLENLYSVRYLSDKSKECFFEIYIALIFHKNNIPYSANVIINGAQKDGYAEINRRQYLVECKKKYSVIADEISIRKFLMKEILKMLNGIPYGFEGIGVVKITANQYKRALFQPVLKEFKNYLTARTDYHPTKLISDENISFEIIELNDANRIELENNLVDYSLYFTIKNLYKIDQGKPLFRVHLFFRAKAPGLIIAKKLIKSLKKARSQHSKETTGRIFFLDNEYLNDFVSPLLNYPESYEQTIADYLIKKDTEDIIVLLIRNFTDKLPIIRHTIIANEKYSATAEVLNVMNFHTMAPCFFRRN